MRVIQLQIKNFRCFESLELSFESPITLIEGLNGTGKTSLLEALHYLCYLRSFRTHMPQELIKFGNDNFFIKASLVADAAQEGYDLQVGFTHKKRLVKLNAAALSSYKELLQYYRIVTVTEDDMALIKEGPEVRRLFIDQAIALDSADFVTHARKNRSLVENRNALLKRGGSQESYHLWSEQLWHSSREIQELRKATLARIEQEVATLIMQYFGNEFTICPTYAPKMHLKDSYNEFIDAHQHLLSDEYRMGRSLFGAHLDDFSIHFRNTKSKNFASRGQQKLIVILFKAAQIRLLSLQNRPAILLLDDFMTDFDARRASLVIKLLTELNIQLIFTAPLSEGFLQKELAKYPHSTVKLTN